jgi:hypothetical protein
MGEIGWVGEVHDEFEISVVVTWEYMGVSSFYVVTDAHVLSCMGCFYFLCSMVSILVVFLFCYSLLE